MGNSIFFFFASCPLDSVDTNDTKSTYRIFYSYYEGLNKKKKNIGAFLPEINIHDSVKKYYPVIREPMYVP